MVDEKTKTEARAAVSRAIAAGVLTRPTVCESCAGPGPIHGHHDDYSAPLAVRWLCRPCHVAHHAKENAAKRSRPTTLGARMAAARLASGLSVAEVTRRAGLPRVGTVYSIENGRSKDPRVPTLIAIANAIGVSVDWLCAEPVAS